MLKCGEDIVVGRGAKKNLRFWSTEDELMKVEIFPDLPPKKANDASALLSIFKNVPPKPTGSIRQNNPPVRATVSDPASEINQRATFPPAYRTSDLEIQNVAKISGSEPSQKSDQNPSVMTQNKDDLFHPETRDEITESIKNKINQIKLRPNESTLVEDTLAAIRDRINTFKGAIELTTMANSGKEETFGIQPVTEEQKVMKAQPETAPVDLLQKAEEERIEQKNEEVIEDLADQMVKLKEVTSNLDRPTNNVAVIRNQIIKLMEENEKEHPAFENSDPLKLSKSETNANQIKMIESIKAQISKLKESGENLENLEEIISGVKKQILSLKESIIPVTDYKLKSPEKVKMDTTNMPSDLPTDDIVKTGLQNQETEMVSDNEDGQQIKREPVINQDLIVDDQVNTDKFYKPDSDISIHEAKKPEVDKTSIEALDQKETKKTEDSNLAQINKVQDVNTETVDGSHFDVSSDKLTKSDVDTETPIKTAIPNMKVKEEHVTVPTAVKDDMGHEDDIVVNNDAKMKPQEYSEQVSNINIAESSDMVTEDALRSSQFEKTDNEQNKEEMEKPSENQSSAVHLDIHSHIEQTTIRKEDSFSLGYIQEDPNDFKITPIIETDNKRSQILETSIDDSSHPVIKDEGEPINEDDSNKPTKPIIQSETQTQNSDHIDQIHANFNKKKKPEDILVDYNQHSVPAQGNIQVPKEDIEDSHIVKKSATKEGAGTKAATEEGTATKSVTEDGTATKSAAEEGIGIKSAAEEGIGTKLNAEEGIGTKSNAGTGTKSVTEEVTGAKSTNVEATGTKSATKEDTVINSTTATTGAKSGTEEGTYMESATKDAIGTKSATEENTDTKSAFEEGTATKSATKEGTATKSAAEEGIGVKSNTEEGTGTKSVTEEVTGTKSANATGTKSATKEATVRNSTTAATGTKSGTEDGTYIESATEDAIGTKSATEENTGTKSEVEEDIDTKSITEEGTATKSATEEGTATKSAAEEGIGVKSAAEEGIGTKSNAEGTGTKSGTEDSTDIESATEDSIGTKSATEENTGTKSAVEEGIDAKSVTEEDTAKQSEKTSDDKPENEIIDQQNQDDAFILKAGEINSDNVESGLLSNVQDSTLMTQSDSETKDSEKVNPIREDETTHMNLKPSEHEHIAISIPKDILYSISNKEHSGVISGDQPTVNENTRINNENSDINSGVSDNANKYQIEIKNENLHPTESDKSSIKDPESLEKTPILPEILDTLKKIEAEKSKLVEKTIPKIILDSLDNDSGRHTTNDATKAEKINIQSDTKDPTQLNLKNFDNFGADHLTETETEQKITGSVEDHHKSDTKTIVEINNEDLSLNKPEPASDSQLADKVVIPQMISVIPKMEDENSAMKGDTSVVTTENEDLIQHEMNFESHSQLLDTTDNQNSKSNSDDIGHHDEGILPIDKVNEDKVHSGVAKIQDDNTESNFKHFDDAMQASKIRLDDESVDIYEKPLIEIDYDGVIKYNEELENKQKHVSEVSTTKKESEVAEIVQQISKIQSGSHNVDETLDVDVSNTFLNQREKDTEKQQSNENEKIKNENNADMATSELGIDTQNLPTLHAENEQFDLNLEPNYSNQYETDIDKFDQYYDDFQDTNKGTTHIDDDVLKVGNFEHPEKFSVHENSNHKVQTDSGSKKTQSDKTNEENMSGITGDDVKNIQEHTQLLNQHNEESGYSKINDTEKVKASEIQASIVRLIEGTLNSAQNSAPSHLENGDKNNIPSTDDMTPIKFDTENSKEVNPENKKDITAAEESSDMDSVKDIISDNLNTQNINEASIRKDEIANEKLSEILAMLNEKRVKAENEKIIKPIEIYPEDIGYDETQKEYIDANIKILKSIVNQVATDLAVNKKEAESKTESNLKPINLIYKPDEEITVNENLGIIDYYSDTAIVPEVIKDVENVQPIIIAQTGDSLKESIKEEHDVDTKTVNKEAVKAITLDQAQNIKAAEESSNLATEIGYTENNAIKTDEKPTEQIQLSRDRINNLINTHKAEILQRQDSKPDTKPNLTTELSKEETLTAEQNKKATNDNLASSKSDQDANKHGEISIPFGFLNWFGKESATKNKASTITNEKNGKITTWTASISDSNRDETTTPFVAENDFLKMAENDDQDNTTDINTTVSSAMDENKSLNIINENSVFSKETGSDNIISLIRDSVVKQQANQVQEETHSEIPISFILTKLPENVAPEEAAFKKPVIIKEHDSKVIFFTPSTNSVDSKSQNDDDSQINSFNPEIDYASETTTQLTNDNEDTQAVIFTNEESPLLESATINKDLMENMEEKTLPGNVTDSDFQILQNNNISPESKMNPADNEPIIENNPGSTSVQGEEPNISPEELLFSDQTKNTTEDTLKSGTPLEDSENHNDKGQIDESEPQAELNNEKDDDNNFLSILEKYVIDESPVNSYIPEEIYHNQRTEDDQENYNININNHNYQSIPINRFSFNNNDYENVRRRIDENMQDNIQYENKRHDNNPPSDIYRSGSSGPSLSSLLQTRKGFIGPSIDEGHTSSQGGVQLRRDDSQHTVGGDSPFFIKLPGSPNVVPVFLQYEPVQVKYVDPEKLKKKNPSLKNEQPILPLFKKNVTSNNQRSTAKLTNEENKHNIDTVHAKIEDERTNEIKSKPDPFFIMEAPDLGKYNGSTDPPILDRPESSPLITDDSLSVNLKGHLNFNQKDSIPSTITGSKPVYPGEYVIKNPDNSYSSSDTQTLSNRVFDLGAKGTIPNSIPENPQYTPFPLTTNPPRTDSITPETTITSTTTRTPELYYTDEENIRNKTENPQSVDYITIPSINFNESFDGIAYPDLPLTERLRDDYGFLESETQNTHEKEDKDENLEDQLVPEIGLFATPKTGIPPKEEEFDIVALANFLHQNQKVWSNNNMAPISEDDGSWRGPVWNNLKYSNVNGDDSWPQPLGDSPWLTNEEGQANARDYTAFYSPEEIPGLDPLYFSYRQMPASSREPRTQETEVENIKSFIEKLPIPLKAAVVGESAPIERSKRAATFGEQIYCEWNFKTEPGLYLLVTFSNLSAPFTVDCYGAYIEVERESNGYGARWCGHRASLTESRQHVIFAKHQVRVSVYDNGDLTKNQVTGFEAEIEAIDLFDSEDYDSFMRSKASSKIRRLMEG